ncbi:MAG: ADP-forming succinate--CoA ligase subunit beta [Alphaproteobacteria bacterium]
MNIHEYQAKILLDSYGLPVPHGVAVLSLVEVKTAAEKLQQERGNDIFMVKAQIHAGGRGAGYFEDKENEKGGVRVAKSIDEVISHATAMLGKKLITKQTTEKGQMVKRLYIETAAMIKKEFYLSLLIDRTIAKLMFVLSTAGGMDIESIAKTNPEKIIKLPIEKNHIDDTAIAAAAKKLFLPDKATDDLKKIMHGLMRLFIEKDCGLIEINPLILTPDDRLWLLDAKINFDDNGLFRHPDIVALRDEAEEEPMELEASKHDLHYIKLDGSIGCMVNGAGLAMATLDMIKQAGASAANFLDVGGGATEAKVKKAFEIILADKNVKGILVNIFGGIMRCDIIANGMIAALKNIKLSIPLVIRLEGTNVAVGKKLLAASDLPIIIADDLAMAADKIVSAIK